MVRQLKKESVYWFCIFLLSGWFVAMPVVWTAYMIGKHIKSGSKGYDEWPISEEMLSTGRIKKLLTYTTNIVTILNV